MAEPMRFCALGMHVAEALEGPVVEYGVCAACLAERGWTPDATADVMRRMLGGEGLEGVSLAGSARAGRAEETAPLPPSARSERPVPRHRLVTWAAPTLRALYAQYPVTDAPWEIMAFGPPQWDAGEGVWVQAAWVREPEEDE